MSSSASDARGTESGRLGGARAAFVASLGRKIQDARELLTDLEDDPSSRSGRDELRRRMHALGAGARLLRFDAMARAVQETLAVLDRSAQTGTMREQDAAFVAQTLDDLPALAWGESAARQVQPDASEPSDEGGQGLPFSVLVVGDETLADALTDDAQLRSRAFECERTEDTATALELARAYAPDVIVIDVDIPGGPALLESLVRDPLTEPVPVVVVGSLQTADKATRIAASGVAKILSKPVSPEGLRTACEEILEAREGRTVRMTLGDPTLEQLAARLSDELRSALLDTVDRPAHSFRVPLGEGTEVLGALWGAIARVQEIVSQRTGGAVRFGGNAPEGAVALAPWLHSELAGSERMAGRGRGAATDVRLDGRRVVVADDDPGVTWFISDLLRTAGCEVYEALDGASALDIAFRVQPELVVSDILMPGMDGFALCRELRRDVALRDTPVILLSWKEDLLQRVRELGASAAAYMRKETDSRAILARVREVLRPRARVETRLRSDGEVRGRLDGLTPRLLLSMVCELRRDARVAVRDATYFYEIEIRGGAPRRATRTASDGSYQRGARALAGLLGVGAGRFVVSPAEESIRGDLTGTLSEQLAVPIAAARGALAATTGARTTNVERIVLDETVLLEYAALTPDPAKALIERLARGTSPRQLLLAGEVSPSLIEDVVSDLALRGAIRGVEGPAGVDLLGPAVESALAILRGPPKTPTPTRPPTVASPVPSSPRGSLPPPPRDSTRTLAEPAERKSAVDADDEGGPSSLEDALMRELSGRSPTPQAARVGKGSRPSGSDLPPLIEPSALQPRFSSAPGAIDSPSTPFSSIPPDAIVPGATSSEEGTAATSSGRPSPLPLDDGAAETVPSTLSSPPPPGPALEQLATRTPSVPEILPVDEILPHVPRADIETTRLPPRPRGSSDSGLRVVPWIEPDDLHLQGATRAPGRWGLVLVVAAFGVLGLVLGWAFRDGGASSPRPLHSASGPSSVEPSYATATASAPTTSGEPSASIPSPSLVPTAGLPDELPTNAQVPAGQGLVEVIAPAGARVRVDGANAGTGPFSSIAAAPGYHEVRVDQGVWESKQTIEVRAGRTTRVAATLSP